MIDLGAKKISVDPTGCFFTFKGAEGFFTIEETIISDMSFEDILEGEEKYKNILSITFWVDTPEGDLGFKGDLEGIEKDLDKFHRLWNVFNLAEQIDKAHSNYNNTKLN